MADSSVLSVYPVPKICYTSAAFLIHGGRLLCVRHRKLDLWLCPGGHVEENELPHVAAERECLEEAGVKVRAVSSMPNNSDAGGMYLPLPFAQNLHWISQVNYQRRVQEPSYYQPDPKWPRGCEQHVCMLYTVELAEETATTEKMNDESTEIGWFTLDELTQMAVTDGFIWEAQRALAVVRSLQSTRNPQSTSPSQAL